MSDLNGAPMPADDLIPGVETKLGRHTYIVPPAPFACVEKYEDVFMGREDAPKPSVIFDILFMSLKRNYPDLDRDALALDVDVSNMQVAFTSSMHANAPVDDAGEA